jgi:hypothetical protein
VSLPLSRVRRKLLFSFFLVAAFLFRLGFGLCGQFIDSDTKQIYLLGLKFYTTRAWPYFGPDVVWGEVQMPGALQGLLVGGPFFLLPLPEAPYVLLNLLSFAALATLAWYCCCRLPELPKWFVWTWLMTAPWVLNLSTVIYNPSYVLFGAVLFFLGLLEAIPATSRNLIPVWAANLMMGFGFLWVMQLHLSWILLLPYIAIAFLFQARNGFLKFVRSAGWFLLGVLMPGLLLLPTWLKYGLSGGNERATVGFSLQNWKSLWGILIRLLSFASFEIPRFLGAHTADRIAFLKDQIWLAPFAVFLFVVGIAQVAALIGFWFVRDHQHQEWKTIKYLMLFTVLVAYASFFFSIKPPQSNHLYLALPLVMIYSLYCWSRLLTRPRWRLFAKVFLACGIVLHLGVAWHNRRRISIYTERQKVQSAIDNQDYRILGERRPGSKY